MDDEIFVYGNKPCKNQDDENRSDTQDLEETKGQLDFLKNPKVKGIRFTVVLVFVAFSIATIVIGALNLDNCQLEPRLPICLAVFGVWGILASIYGGFFECLPKQWLQILLLYLLYLLIFTWVGAAGTWLVFSGMTSSVSHDNRSSEFSCLQNQTSNTSSHNGSNATTIGEPAKLDKTCDPVTHGLITGIVLTMDICYILTIASLGIYKWKDKAVLKTQSVVRNKWSSNKKLQSFGPALLLLLNAVFAVQCIFPSYILSQDCCPDLLGPLSMSLYSFAIFPAISIAMLSLALMLYYFRNEFSAVYPGALMLVYMVPWCVFEFYASGIFFTHYHSYNMRDAILLKSCGVSPYQVMYLVHISFYIFELPFVIISSCASLWLLWQYQKDHFFY
ncbi:uncharacterized protein LOC100181338 [Ciona intestinalis]